MQPLAATPQKAVGRATTVSAHAAPLRRPSWTAPQAAPVLVPAFLVGTGRLVSRSPASQGSRLTSRPRATRALRRQGRVGEDVLPQGGPTVVISGASQGTGRAMALKFARAGFNVVLAARSLEALQEAEELCQAALKPGRAAMAVPCDITSAESVQQLFDQVTARFTDVRVVVCNAGVCMTGEVLDTSMQDFQSQLDVNFLGHVSTVRTFLPQLLQQAGRSGPTPTVCFVNSFGARVPLPDMTAYCAAKYALQGFADSLRLELTPAGVHVATVHPGVIRSDFRTRAQWRGSAAGGRRSTMDSQLASSTVVHLKF